jgi:hypothetical protein
MESNGSGGKLAGQRGSRQPRVLNYAQENDREDSTVMWTVRGTSAEERGLNIIIYTCVH